MSTRREKDQFEDKKELSSSDLVFELEKGDLTILSAILISWCVMLSCHITSG